MGAREKLLGMLSEGSVAEVSHEEDIGNRKRARGANALKNMLRLVPLPDNPDFGGQGMSIPYHHVGLIRFSLDYTRIEVFLPMGRLTLLGERLKSLLDQVEECLEGCIEETDPLQAAGRARDYCVTEMRFEASER